MDAEVLVKIGELASLGHLAATEIYRELERVFGDSFAGQGRSLPDVRTVQRIVRDFVPEDPASPWSLNHETADAGFVFAALREAMWWSYGSVRSVSRSVARWIVTIHRAAPDLDPMSAYRLGRMYLVREERNLPTDDLDAWLAFAPWRGVVYADRYAEATRLGWISPAPIAVSFPDLVERARTGLADQAVPPYGDPWISELERKAADEVPPANVSDRRSGRTRQRGGTEPRVL